MDGFYGHTGHSRCFWPGEPEIIIPYSAAKPFLTKEAIKTAGL